MINKKIKILRILNRFNLGGPIHNATLLTKYLDSNKFETILVGGKWEDHEKSGLFILEKESINYKVLPSMRRKISFIYDVISLFNIIKIIYNYKPGIIHTHAAKAGFIGRIASFFYFKKIKLVHTYHGNVFEGYFSKNINKIILGVERFLSNYTDKIIAISQTQKEDLLYKYKIGNKKKIQVVKLGFNLDKFSKNKAKKRKKIREEFGINHNEILISIIGRIVPVKNHKFFVDVFSNCKQNSNQKIRALIIGDGSETKKIIEYSKSKGLKINYKSLEDHDYDIFFCSWKKDIDYFLAASDIVSLTSINEGTPVSIIESMSSGTASISTNVGGVTDIIDNNISGIVSTNSVDDYTKNLLKLIENENFRESIANKGKKISEIYSHKVLIKNFEILYKNLLKKSDE